MAHLSSLEHTAIGALSGTIEVCIMQPTVGIKNALQEGRPIPRTPAGLYRGLSINASSMAPITAVQFGAYRAAENLLTGLTGRFWLPCSCCVRTKMWPPRSVIEQHWRSRQTATIRRDSSAVL